MSDSSAPRPSPASPSESPEPSPRDPSAASSSTRSTPPAPTAPTVPTVPTIGELQSRLSECSRKREKLLGAIHAARAEARRVSIEAASCHQPIPQATIDKWQRDIKERSAEL